MIVYFLGIPGSGKTYYGVNVIYDNFANNIPKKTKLSLKKDYENCYTNINEFNFDLLHDVYHLDYDDLYQKLQILYDMANGVEVNASSSYKTLILSYVPTIGEITKFGISLKDAKEMIANIKEVNETRELEFKKAIKEVKKVKKASDAELIEKAKELNIYKTLFVIDECHNFFDTQDKVKVWWLTYHRHLYHDIYLITQNLGLVNLKYKPLAEAFYKAKSSSLTLNKKYFNYMYYTDSRLTKDSYVETKKIPKNQEVFKLYKSGDKVESKNVILKFIYIAIFLFIILFVLGYFFYYEKAKDIKSQKVNINKPVEYQQSRNNKLSKKIIYTSINSNTDDYSDKKFIKLNCSFSVCSNDNISLPPQLLKKFIDMELIHKFYDEKINKYLTIVYLSTSSDFYKFILNKGVTENEKSDSMDIDLFGSSNSK